MGNIWSERDKDIELPWEKFGDREMEVTWETFGERERWK